MNLAVNYKCRKTGSETIILIPCITKENGEFHAVKIKKKSQDIMWTEERKDSDELILELKKEIVKLLNNN